MLNLYAGVHLKEMERAICGDEELDSTCSEIIDGPGGRHRGTTHRLTGLFINRCARRLLDHLLVPPLHAALPLKQMDDISIVVSQHLHLDVPRGLEQGFDIDRAITECRQSLTLGCDVGSVQLSR
uniref:Uncharacterized protein n=1 Tax=uncultured marine group II/III euryarchaeote KM3_05_H10 TaxID=1457839 RepID=A0A075G390_9EURY|nr:hypothetical protein [uncultured marine group II/III euryarchaeote KM3_05_H10]